MRRQSGLALAQGVGSGSGDKQRRGGEAYAEDGGTGVTDLVARLGGGLLGTVVLAVGLAGVAGLLDQLVGGGLEPRQRLVHFLLVGGVLQHLLRVGERDGSCLPCRNLETLL